MKGKIIVGSILAIASFVFVACSSDSDKMDFDKDLYVTIPDSSFEAELIEQGIDSDGIVNQEILKAHVEKVSELDLSNSKADKIKDLTGIEAFTNLHYLVANQHEIASIDLSANTLLDTIYFSGNYLNSIDLSENTNLILVDVQANGLKSITGISELTHLKKLNVSWNDLEQLTVQNESIEVLHASQNLLSSLNTEGSVNLKNILLRTNKLATVNFSSNVLLETLVLPDNKLENINLEQNSKLTHFHIFDNLLSDLDLSNNLDLVEIKVDRNESLTCIKINEGQYIPSVSISDYQKLSSTCD